MAALRRSPLRVALEEARSHPVRVFLVAQGMVWGVALAVVPAAIIQGSMRQATERAGELGTNRIQLEPAPSAGRAAAPREADLGPLREAVGAGVPVSGLRVEPARPPAGVPEVWLLGCDGELPAARGRRILEGRFPAEDPVPRAERRGTGEPEAAEAALEAHLAGIIFPHGPAVGRRLWLSRTPGAMPALARAEEGAALPPGAIPLEVVGVVEDDTSRPMDRFGYEEGRAFSAVVRELLRAIGIYPRSVPWLEKGLGIYLPRSLVPGERLDWIFATGDPRDLEGSARALEGTLVARGRIPLIYTNAVWSILSRPELEGYLDLNRIFFGLFVSIGLVVLADLLLLSGWRRRGEIALRQAEGARRSDIFLQFLWEGLLIALVGLVAGTIAGMLLAWLRVALDPNVATHLEWPWGDLLRAGAILTAGALLASALPAWRASRFHPMGLFRRVA